MLQCNFETLEIWDTIEPGGANVKRARDRQAMAGILRSVPSEMWQMLGAKKNVKEAWEAVKSMRIGADRVKEANAQRLLKEFENIKFNDSESVDEFAMRIGALAVDLRTSGEIGRLRIVIDLCRVHHHPSMVERRGGNRRKAAALVGVETMSLRRMAP